ncbi:hypothetical protein KC217_19455, partial [Mycobacterium tuberculosis]|nr:hypothetical protein [Mycobacterium tuberculosis]
LWTFLVGFGAVLAAGGIVQDLAAPRTLLIFEKTSYVGDLTLSFVNRNTAATFLGVLLLLVLGRLLQHYDTLRFDRRGQGYPPARLDGLWPAMVAAFIVLVALFLTRSRGGAAATLAALAVGGGLAIIRYGGNRGWLGRW